MGTTATATAPIRILRSDHGPVRLLAKMQKRSPAEVIHEALDMYIVENWEELEPGFERLKKAFDDGDIDAVGDLLDDPVATMARDAVGAVEKLRRDS